MSAIPHSSHSGTELSFRHNNIDKKTKIQLEQIAQEISECQTLETLCLDCNAFYAMDAEHLRILTSAVARNRTLRRLELNHIDLPRFDEKRLGILLNVSSASSLTELTLSGDKIGILSKTQLQILTTATMNMTMLTELDLSGNELGTLTEEAMRIFLCTIISHPKLLRLNLSYNPLHSLNKEAFRAFAEGIEHCTNINFIDLSLTSLEELNNEQMGILAFGVGRNRTLIGLDLSNNSLSCFTEDMIRTLFRGIKANHSINTIFLNCGSIDSLNDEQFEIFMDELFNNENIEINLNGDELTFQSRRELFDCFHSRNKKLRNIRDALEIKTIFQCILQGISSEIQMSYDPLKTCLIEYLENGKRMFENYKLMGSIEQQNVEQYKKPILIAATLERTRMKEEWGKKYDLISTFGSKDTESCRPSCD